ncbi:PVC-type heme-binding CxxCH protein [Luteolibacter marinus]|uniref:PVC-type heme-binding CxxCH protein n=1 Tax=Luteolibacter marinus TaxID=2776705 RepID=UPI001866D345|nr:PVC-type heme-binding CxxCH protein [Luteolibacter marinus]
MTLNPSFASLLALAATGSTLLAAPLRVLVSSDDNDFRDRYAAALKKAGAQVVASTSPDEAALAKADVLLLHRSEYTALPAASQQALTEFTGRGGGIVAVNAAIAAGTPEWGLATLGGAWDEKDSRKFMSTMMLYVVTDSHPVVKDASPFDIEDDTLYDLTFSDDIQVLASAYTPKGRDAKRGDGPKVPGRDVRASIYDIQPQMWAYEASKHRAAVYLPGAAETLAHASSRAFILRSVAWTGKRENVDEFCGPAELADLRYPAGGPKRAADAIREFKMQPGFQASVVAAEPLISKPIAVQWDAAGRLWVAETPEYPNGRRPLNAPAWKETGVLEPGNYDRPARDSISMLVDSDGDGQADKKHVFYEGLELVTGFCFHEDGVIAVAQPSIVWLRDTDGDGKAETVTPLFDGFAPGDTHFVANHFITAPDGWIYVNTGSGADAKDPKTGKVVAKISPGVFRFKPDGSAIEQIASQGGNSFGGEVTSDMEIFHGKATSGNPIQHVVLPETVLSRAANTRAQSFSSVNPGRTIARSDLPTRAPLMQIDQVGRYSAACSTMVYEGGAWPKEYDGKVFVTEGILDTIHHEELVPDGATFKGELVLKDQEWLRSMDYWFCPIDITFGPDGAAYVLDFYTPVVAHNDTRGPQHSKSGASVRPDRDHHFGRIYRIQHQAAAKLSNPDLYHADAASLVAAFKHPNRVVRFNAIRLLVEKQEALGKQAVPALTAMAKGEAFIPARIQALWALQRLGALDDATLAAAFSAPDSKVRKNAMLIAEAGGLPLDGKQVTAGIDDPDARVRLATLRALGASAMSQEASAALLAASSKLRDPWSKAAAAAAGSRNPSSQLESILAAEGDTGQSGDTVRSLAAALAESGDAKQLLGVIRAAGTSPHADLAVIALDEIGKRPLKRPGNAKAMLDALRPLLVSKNQQLAAAALPLAVRWDRRRYLHNDAFNVVQILFQWLRDPQRSDADRAHAARKLIAARAFDPKILGNVIGALDGEISYAFASELIAALSASGEPAVGSALVARYPALPALQKELAFGALVSRPEWTKLLLDAVEAKTIAADTLQPAQVSRLTSHPDADTAKRATALFGGAGMSKDKIIADLLPEVSKPGDIANGKTMFAAVCSSCHRLEGAGHKFGPDLDGIGSHPVLELLTHIVNPNLVVDDEHRTWNITMKDGRQFSALIASENEARVQIRQPGGVTTDLKAADIASRAKGDNSLMPEGLDAMGAATLRDIIGYMRSVAPQATPESK